MLDGTIVENTQDRCRGISKTTIAMRRHRRRINEIIINKQTDRLGIHETNWDWISASIPGKSNMGREEALATKESKN